MLARPLRRSLYKWAWDTRCRNVDVARVIRPLLNSGSTLLDAGCGEYGLSAFVDAKSVVGVDVIPALESSDGFDFIYGSIVALPFAERSFSIAASVDVLEHLPAAIRPAAIRQLVDVADRAIVIAFPSGKKAREIDIAFNKELVDSAQPIPDWLAEHLQNPYPEDEMVLAEIEGEAARLGRRVRTSILHSEDLRAARFLRWSAVRSRYLYMFGNLLLGLVLPLIPRPKRGYRSIILAEFVND